MKKDWIFICIIALVAGAVAWSFDKYSQYVADSICSDDSCIVYSVKYDDVSNMIRLSTPTSGGTVRSPIRIEGVARGGWFFEASFPVFVVNWDGLIIGEGIATAEGEWMTNDFVKFKANISYTSPTYSNRGALILKKDNPSGDPKFDMALEIPITLE